MVMKEIEEAIKELIEIAIYIDNKTNSKWST